MKSWDALLIESLKKSNVDKVPKGFKTAREWAKVYGKGVRTVEEMFRRLGVKQKKFKILVGNRNVKDVTHWRG